MFSWGTMAFYSETSCFFFFLVSFFSIQLTNPISGNASKAKWKKKGDGLTQKKKKLIGCISSSLDCFSITKKFRESFPARQTLHDNFLINDIGNAQFYRKLKYTCMQIWSNKIWYSHCPDLFVYTSSSLAFFLMQWVKSTVIFPSRPCFNFLCGQELFQQFLRDLSAKGIRLSVVEFNRKYMKLTKFVCDLRA